ncbi:MAG: hypothetical protein LBG81_04095, partial [Coriobacteriaceae bacterium]|nr:hypothetical protein [Coriobacteriaceae bacterium]
AIPVIGNAATDLVKTTSLAFTMAVTDVMGLAKIEAASSLDYLDSYLAVFFIYLIVVLALENVFKLVDHRLGASRRSGRPQRQHAPGLGGTWGIGGVGGSRGVGATEGSRGIDGTRAIGGVEGIGCVKEAMIRHVGKSNPEAGRSRTAEKR